MSRYAEGKPDHELTEDQKIALAAQERQAKMWVRVQADEAASRKAAEDSARVSSMDAVEFDRWSREQIAKGDAARREAAEQSERESRERGARLRAGADG